MKFTLLFLSLFVFSYTSFAQFGETMRTGRPGQSIGAYSVGKSVFQVQSGFTNNQFSTEDPSTIILEESWQHTTVLRYGLTEQLEVSGVIGGRWDKTERDGINNTQLGLRYNLFGSSGARPAVCIQGRLLLPVGTDEVKRDQLGSRFLIGAGNSLTDRLSLTTNLGLTLPGGKPAIYTYSAALGISLTDRLGAFVEAYDSFAEFDQAIVNFDAGLGYFINDDLKIDVSTGWENRDSRVRKWFVDFGVSFRFHQRGEN